MKRLNQQGKVIMSAATLSGYRSIPKLAKAIGMPYRTLYEWLTVDAGSITLDRLTAIIRVTHMKPEQVYELTKGG